MAESPATRCLKRCRKLGWPPATVERWIPIPGFPGGGKRRDMYGGIDIVAMTPTGTLGIQACSGLSGNGLAKHCHKLELLPGLCTQREEDPEEPWEGPCWTAGPGSRDRYLEVWAWAKRGPRGKRKLWTLRVVRWLPFPAYIAGGTWVQPGPGYPPLAANPYR
jgi:hypothetical protein